MRRKSLDIITSAANNITRQVYQKEKQRLSEAQAFIAFAANTTYRQCYAFEGKKRRRNGHYQYKQAAAGLGGSEITLRED